MNQVNVIKSHGKSMMETQLIENGYAMQLPRVAQGCPTHVANAKIALLDFDVKKYCMRNAEILVSDPAELEKIRQKEMDITGDMINKVYYHQKLIRFLERGRMWSLRQKGWTICLSNIS